MRITELAEKLANRVWMRLHTGRVVQGRGQLRHRDVAILLDDFGEKAAMWVEFPLTFGPTLRRGSRFASPADCKPPPRAPVAGESCKRNAAARPLNSFSINL